MATFHSLTPPMGSHSIRHAPDMLSIELELQLPQDHFLPAENIVAEVWTNILHKHNPDGPEVWAAVPMKLTHVIPGQSIAVFSARFQPTGRGDFGLTARWKSHKDLTEWQWAPAPEKKSQSNDPYEEKQITDVSISVKVPRNISGTSPWTMGPQSVMIYGPDGPRVEGNGLGSGVGGPGLYLGNHAAATRARISGYDSVLSLVGDILDFDEKIPESDRDLLKKIWDEQAASTKRPTSYSRPLSMTSYENLYSNSSLSNSSTNGQSEGHSRKSSIHEFMTRHEPGSTNGDDIASVVDNPEDPPRLTRRSSVTEMMVKLPTSNSSRHTGRDKSISSVAEIEPEQTKAKDVESKAPAAAAAASVAPAQNTNTKSKGKKASKNKNSGAAAVPVTDTAAAAKSIQTPPTSQKKSENQIPITTDLPSPSISTLVSSLQVSSANGKNSEADKSPGLKLSTDATKTATNVEHITPPSSAKVITGLHDQTWSSGNHQDIRLTTESNSTERSMASSPTKRPFEHKVISIAPGSHSIISDAALKEAVSFLQSEIASGKKVLVHCRDGNGRGGSVAIAYVASQFQKDGQGNIYDRALNEVWKWKCDVYPHKGLKQSVERIVW